MEYTVIKRNKTIQKFDPQKVYTAVMKCFADCPGEHTEQVAKLIQDSVSELVKTSDTQYSVEDIQDVVERMLMELGYYDQAKKYILYRQKRAELRRKRLHPDNSAIADYIHFSKYARYIPNQKRRELYSETVDRVKNMHLAKYPYLEQYINDAFSLVYDKRVLPSMRAMQFAGKAIEKDNARIYNCSFSYFDRPEFIKEAMYLLLCGTGVGFSVQKQHVNKLPALKTITLDSKVVHHSIDDSKEGWAIAFQLLFDSYVNGYYIEFDYSRIRDRGALLVTSGGRAPGHRGLKRSLEKIRTQVLDPAQGRKLRPIECHKFVCVMADAVLSGGIRRSACISLFSQDDNEMMYCKTGEWYKEWPELANANNSVVLIPGQVSKEFFDQVISCTKQWGEPGFFFTEDLDYGINPCGEALLTPKFDDETGWSFCNLTEINAAKFEKPEDFMAAARAAAIIGTLQAGYTDFPFLSSVAEKAIRRDSLLGVSLTGMMESPEIAFDPELQRRAADVVLKTNIELVDIMRQHGVEINYAARATLVKPSGTSSLELGIATTGIHPAHSDRYFRRVTANSTEPVFKHFKSVNPHMCVQKPNGDWVIEFPLETKPGTLRISDLSALEFLQKVKLTQENWVNAGTNQEALKKFPGAVHGVSNTVTVKEDEWDQVTQFLWENQQHLRGVSLLPDFADTAYEFAPRSSVKSQEDELRWNSIIRDYVKVDYSEMFEDLDNTEVQTEVACGGGACELST